MVLFQNVIEKLALPYSSKAPELAVLLHLRDSTWVGGVLVDGNGAWVHCVQLPERFAEEAFRSRRVPLGREQEVDRLAAAVDCAIQVHPPGFRLHRGFVDP